MISRSPDRHTFRMQSYEKVLADASADEEARTAAKKMIDFYTKYKQDNSENEMSDDWKQNNLEYDLRTTDWILKKARDSETYAQNIYAALCNNEFMKLDTFQILREDTWSCSWRHAGGIVADMRVEGDYIDWYCSGMGDGLGNGDSDGSRGYASEGTVTDEIREDFKKLGWAVWSNEDER